MENFYTNKNILITGGTGSLGQAITTILQNINCNIYCLSRDEYKQWYIKNRKFKQTHNNIHFILGDIRDKIIEKHFKNIDIVIHTAALKHIDYCENNSEYAIDINVNGTANLLQLAKKNNVKYFISVSTDKACSPSNTYGATKLLTERLTLNNDCDEMKCSVIRFGNIFASRGSVAHAFHDSIVMNKKLVIYNPNMTRFSVSIEDAAKNCLNIPLLSHGGDIIIPKSKSYNILTLAKAFLKTYKGDDVDIMTNIEIKELRTSEKIHEELISDYEFNKIYNMDNFYIAITDIKKHNLYEKKNIIDITNLNSNTGLLTDEELGVIIKKFKKNKEDRKFMW
jgi:FlaA1/EpsC-like NDP-sugar epimerase